MCGAYRLKATPGALHARFGIAELTDMAPRELIRPGEPVAIVRLEEDGRRHLRHVLWGLVPGWMKRWPARRVINARAETLLERPFFRGAAKHRRCLVPADGFHEWAGPRGRKVPRLFTLADGRPFAMAGIWERWQGPDGGEVETLAIITVPANADVAPVHDRMPALLRREHWVAWLNAREVPAARAARLLRPAPDGTLRHTALAPPRPERGDHPRLL